MTKRENEEDRRRGDSGYWRKAKRGRRVLTAIRRQGVELERSEEDPWKTKVEYHYLLSIKGSNRDELELFMLGLAGGYWQKWRYDFM